MSLISSNTTKLDGEFDYLQRLFSQSSIQEASSSMQQTPPPAIYDHKIRKQELLNDMIEKLVVDLSLVPESKREKFISKDLKKRIEKIIDAAEISKGEFRLANQFYHPIPLKHVTVNFWSHKKDAQKTQLKSALLQEVITGLNLLTPKSQ